MISRTPPVHAAAIATAAWVLSLLLLVAAPAAATATPPTAATAASSGPDDSYVMRWIGTAVFSQWRSDLQKIDLTEHWSDVVLEYRCDGAVCDLTVTGGVTTDSRWGADNALLATRDFSALTLDDGGGFTRDFGPVGNPCVHDEPVLPISHAEGTLTPTTAVMTFTTEEWSGPCAGGGSSTYWASTRTFEGVYVSGDSCALGAAMCPVVEVAVLTSPSPSPRPTTEPSPVADAPKLPVEPAGSVSRLASGEAAAPSVLSALIPLQDSEVGILDVGLAVVVTVILSLLVAFPKKLFSSAIGAAPKRWTEYRDWLRRREGGVATHWDRTLEWLGARRDSLAGHGHAEDVALADVALADVAPDGSAPEGAAADDGPPNHAILSGPWRRAAAGVVLAGVISAFVDPGFGLNWGSLRVAVSLSASFVLTVVIGWGVAIWIARRFTPGLAASYSFKPLSLVLVALTVIFTRVTGMQPGMVFGLVAGVALGAMSSKATEARVAVAQTGYAFIAGVAGWLTYSALVPSLSGSPHVFSVLLLDTLSGLSVAGFAAAPLALLPVAGMGGATVFEWNPRAWFAMYSAGLVGFFVVLMPMSYSWREVDFSLRAWVSLYVVYSAASVIAYLALVRPWSRALEAGAEEVEAEDVEADVG